MRFGIHMYCVDERTLPERDMDYLSAAVVDPDLQRPRPQMA